MRTQSRRSKHIILHLNLYLYLNLLGMTFSASIVVVHPCITHSRVHIVEHEFWGSIACVRRRPFWVERNDSQKHGCVRKLGEA